jgi:hypothetical protein
MNQQPRLNNEDILITLDQLDQTLDVLTQVVKRLKHDITNSAPPTAPPLIDRQTDDTLH